MKNLLKLFGYVLANREEMEHVVIHCAHTPANSSKAYLLSTEIWNSDLKEPKKIMENLGIILYVVNHDIIGECRVTIYSKNRRYGRTLQYIETLDVWC